METIEKLKSEKEVLNFLFELHEKDINESDVESVSTDIYNMMMKHPTASSWSDFRFAISNQNIVLSELIHVNEMNLESVILRKYREDARKTRTILFGHSDMDPLYTPE